MKRMMTLFGMMLASCAAMADMEVVDDITWTYTISDGKAIVTKANPATGAVTIPSTLGGRSVKIIGANAFYYCDGLTSVTIPEGVTSIVYDAFRYCSGLTSVTIPSSVTSIGDYAFSDCSALTSVTMPEGVTSIGRCAFCLCSGLTSVTIPTSVTSIGENAFSGCSGLTSVTIPSSVTSIDDYTFRSCSGLMSVTIPESVTSIGKEAFSGCSGLTSVTIPSNVTSIDYQTFYGCSGLTSVTIPSSVMTIGGRAFSGCSGLTSVTISEGVTSIGYEAFLGCSGLTNVTIPSSVTSIGHEAFYGCSGLTSVTIPSSVASIGGYAFAATPFCGKLPDGMVILGSVLYEYRGTCPDVVTIPEGVTTIGDSAFYCCVGLTSVAIPEGVASIGYGAFKDCSGLTNVTIPSSVTSIGLSAFEDCSGLTNVVFGGNAPTCEYNRAFDGVKSGCTATVYEGTAGWDDDGDGMWQGLTLVYRKHPIPSIGENPTKMQIAAALDGSADARLAACITNATNYNAYRTWANKIDPQAVKDSSNAWVSFALGSDKLLEKPPTDEDLTVEKFEPTSEAGKFDFTVSVDGVEVGSDAQKENLKQVFGLEGAATLAPDDFTSDNIDLTFGTPTDGKVKFTAGPKDTKAATFFMKVKVK